MPFGRRGGRIGLPAVVHVGADALVVHAARGRRAGSRSAGGSAAAATLPRTCSTLRAPGMTAVTPGWSITQRSANAAVGTSSPAISATSRAAATPTSNGTPAKVSPTSNASPWRLKFRWSSAGNVVDSSYLPVSSPLASGTRARTPTPARPRRGQQLLQRLAPEDVEDDLDRLHARVLQRGQPLGDGLHRDAVGGDRAVRDEARRARRTPAGRSRRPAAGSAAAPGRGCRRRGCGGTGRSRRAGSPACTARPRTGRRGGRPWSRRTAGPTAGASALRMRSSERPSP